LVSEIGFNVLLDSIKRGLICNSSWLYYFQPSGFDIFINSVKCFHIFFCDMKNQNVSGQRYMFHTKTFSSLWLKGI